MLRLPRGLKQMQHIVQRLVRYGIVTVKKQVTPLIMCVSFQSPTLEPFSRT